MTRGDEAKRKQEIEQQLQQGDDAEISLGRIKLALTDFPPGIS